MENEKEIEFKELVKLDPDYLSIRISENEVYASKDFEVKIDGDYERITKQYVTKIPIRLSAYGERKPKAISFHWGDCETLKCLLSHKPTELNIDYYESNQSDYLRDNKIDQETFTVKGFKGKKVYSVRFNSPRAVDDYNMFSYMAHF